MIPPTMHKISGYPKFSETLEGCQRSFSALWDQKFSPEKRDTLYYTWYILIPQFLWNIERMPTENLGTVRPKVFAKKTWYLLLCIKIFDTPNSLKHCTDAHLNFRQFEIKKIAKKTWYPLLCITIFDTPSFLKHWRDAHEFFWHGETENLRRKNVIHFSIHEFFRYSNFFETMRPKIFAGKRDTPYYAWNYSIPEIFWKLNGMSTKFLGTVRQKFFDGNLCYPLLYLKFFDNSDYLKHYRMPTNFFGTVKPKFFAGRTSYPLLYKKLFDTPISLKSWRDGHEFFRYCDT